MEQNKTGRYFKYAIGEIILVVIGILIALQINNWNLKTIDAKKEKSYLLEIRENLKTDLVALDSILTFNRAKKESVAFVFENFANSELQDDVPIVRNNIYTLGTYERFFPIDLGFKNLISAENIGLIKDDALRKNLLNFYNFDFKGGVQERMRIVTRNFVDYIMPKITTKEHYENTYNVKLNIPSDKDVELSEDQELLSMLFLMDVVINFQNDLLMQKKKDINNLIELIESQ